MMNYRWLKTDETIFSHFTSDRGNYFNTVYM